MILNGDFLSDDDDDDDDDYGDDDDFNNDNKNIHIFFLQIEIF